jgi:glycerophosphoryl diester phosphodiesterase
VPNHPLPEIVAHRGASRDRPENTLAAFALALDQGADAIELDVHATRDGVVVVHHDPVLRAPAQPPDRRPRIAEITHAELRALAPDGDTGIPTLAEVLELVGTRARVYVEIKGRAVERQVLDVLRDGRTDCAVHAFDHRVPQRVRALAPGVPVGILLTSYLLDVAAAVRPVPARDVWQDWTLIDDAWVAAVRAVGGRSVAWTVNDPAAGVALARLGVEALCTDVPGLMRAALAAAL